MLKVLMRLQSGKDSMVIVGSQRQGHVPGVPTGWVRHAVAYKATTPGLLVPPRA